MLDLFFTFMKINLLTTSGPASIGLTKQLVVPTLMPEDKFNQMLALASGIPGSDAIQMAWQIGYFSHGLLGSLVAVTGALVPCVALVAMLSFGLKFIEPCHLQNFFKGVNPALCMILILTAYSLYHPFNGDGSAPSMIFLSAAALMYFNIPLPVILLVSGTLGVALL